MDNPHSPGDIPGNTPGDMILETRGSAALIAFNRPKALNALTTAMRATLAEAFPRFARDPQIYAAVMQSSSPKAFSAGADVREMTTWGRENRSQARQSFKDEYTLNWLLECFSKPTVSLIDGLCMGSGVGVSVYGTHRVAGENYRFAMPETAIGFFPDVGVAHLLGRLPRHIGLYLGLTGRTIGRADAYRLGLATHCIPAGRFPEIVAGLADAWPVDPLLDDRHVDPGPGDLDRYGDAIASCFSGGSVAEIVDRLMSVSWAEAAWAKSVLADLGARAPLALAVAFRHIRAASQKDLRETLATDYRLACQFLEDPDFYEGVRAALIEKDGKPQWRPSRIEDVTTAAVDAYFAARGADELILPTRAEMQEARV